MPDETVCETVFAHFLRERAKDVGQKIEHATKTGKCWAEPLDLYTDADGNIRMDLLQYGPSGVDVKRGLTWEKAWKYMNLVTQAYDHLAVIFDACLLDDQKRIVDYVRKLHSTIKDARKLGPPEKPYKAAVMKLVLEWMAGCSNPPDKLKVRRAIRKILKRLGQNPSQATITNWVNEAIQLDARRRQKC